MTVNAFIGLLENALGKKADIHYGPEQGGDVPMTCADMTKASRLLGYRPRVSLEEGIARFVDWYRRSGRVNVLTSEGKPS